MCVCVCVYIHTHIYLYTCMHMYMYIRVCTEPPCIGAPYDDRFTPMEHLTPPPPQQPARSGSY